MSVRSLHWRRICNGIRFIPIKLRPIVAAALAQSRRSAPLLPLYHVAQLDTHAPVPAGRVPLPEGLATQESRESRREGLRMGRPQACDDDSSAGPALPRAPPPACG